MKRWLARHLILALLWLADRLHAGDWHCRQLARRLQHWSHR